MRVIFAGTPVFAERALAAIHAAGHEIVLVLTRADKPAGRGQKLQSSPVKQLAERLGIALAQPVTLADPQIVQVLADAKADVMVVAAYGRLLPPSILSLPRLGCLNIHASLLPRWRGAAPIQRAIEAGDPQTGITIMQMDAGLDTGAMLLKKMTPIADSDSAATVHDRLAELGAQAIVQVLTALEHGPVPAEAQPEEGVTYAKKVEKSERRIDWRTSKQVIANRIRAFDPAPGCVTALAAQDGSDGESLKIWRAAPLHANGAPNDCAEPGAIQIDAAGRLCVRCGDGWLQLLELQRAGGRRIAAAQYLAGARPEQRTRFAPC